MITLTNLSKQYSGVTALNIPELTLEEGELVGLVGNNGAGKTTMMRLMLDLIQATSGYVTIDGKRVDQDDAWKSFTGSFLDSTFLIDFYTPEEFFGFIGEVYDIPQSELQLQHFEALMGGEILGTGKLIHDFSNGNRQKIGIIGAMLIQPRVLVLDEPFNYLDPSSQIVVARLIREMNRDRGTTVLVSSHNLNSISDICGRILLLEKGNLIMDKPHVPGSMDPELEAYFLEAVK
jgi:ABC-type multidrug transport system, ATPase component